MTVSKTNIYQIYAHNGCRFHFFVRRDTWQPNCYAKVVGIEDVKEGEMIGNPPDHNRGAGKIMWPRLVTLEADWLIGGIVEIDSGGEFCWEQVYPKPQKVSD